MPETGGNTTYTGLTTINAGTEMLVSFVGSGDQTASNSAHTINGQLTILSGSNIIGSLAGSGSVILNGGSLTTGGENTSTTFSGIISGSSNFTKAGSGTMILTGTNTNSGTWTISGGTLQIGNGGTSGTLGSGNVTNNAVLEFNRDDNTTIDNTISGTGSVVVNGNSITTITGFSGDNSYSGGLNLETGYLSLEHANAAGTGTITVNGPFTNIIYIDGGLTIANAIQLNEDLWVWARSGGATLSGQLSGTGELLVSGSDVLQLTDSSNDFTGDIKISSDLRVSSDGQLGNTANEMTFQGGTLEATGTFTTNRTLRLDSLGMNTIDVASGQTLTADGTIEDVLAGANGLIKAGAGTLQIGGNNTYTGGTTLDAGTLIIGHENALGTGDLTINGGTLANDANNRTLPNNLIVNSNFSVDSQAGFSLSVNDANYGNAMRTVNSLDGGNFNIAGVVSGTAGVNYVKAGLSDVVIQYEGSAANTLTGTTTVGNDVTLALAKDDNVNAIADALVIQNGGMVVVNAIEQIADTATVTVNNGGTLSFGPSETETLGNLQGNGTVNLGAMAPGSQLILNSGNFSGVISGGNAAQTSLAKATGGMLSLSGTNTFQGSIAINGGTLQIGSDDNLGNANNQLTFNGGTLSVTNTFTTARNANSTGGNITIGAGQTLTMTGNLSGAGGLTFNGPGTTRLAGNNSIATINVADGTVQLADADAAASNNMDFSGGTLELDTPGTPTFNFDSSLSADATLRATRDTVLDTVFSSASPMHTLAIEGPASLQLTGNSSMFNATMTNDANVLTNNGQIGGLFINNTQLFGVGTFNNLTNNGTFQPGNSIGQTQVAGNYVENGTLVIEYDPTDPNFPTNPGTTQDLVSVTGTATFDAASTIQVIPTTDVSVAGGTQMTIVIADGGVIDNGVTITSTSNFVGWKKIVNPFDLTLESFFLTFTNGITNKNQYNTALGLDAITATNPAPGSPAATFINNLSGLTPAQLEQALTQLSPQRVDVPRQANHDNVQGVSNTISQYLTARRMGLPMNNPSNNATQLGPMFASTDNTAYLMMLANMSDEADDNTSSRITQNNSLTGSKLNIWAQGFYLNSNVDSSTNTTGYHANTGGGMFGLDYPVMDNLILGVSFAFTGTHATYDSPGGELDMFTYRIGPDLSWEPVERLYIDFSLSYAFSHMEQERTTTTGLVTTTAEADYLGHDISVYLGAEYDLIEDRQWYVAPLAGMDYTWFYQEGYTETGAGPANMVIDEQQTHALSARVGARFAWMKKLSENLTLVPEALVAYRRDFSLGDDTVSARFVDAASGFEVPRGSDDEDGLEVGAGLSFLVDESWSVYARYNGSFYDNATSHMATVGVRFSF